MQKLTDAIRSLANGKAVRPDRVSVELLKITLNSDPALRRRLLDIVVRIWRGGRGGTVVERCHHHGTPQKEGSDRVRQLHGHLVCSAGKVLLKIIARRLSEYCERVGILPEEQNGCRPNRSTADMMFVIRRLQKLALKKRILLYVCFIDLTKAYDSVERTLLWRALARVGVPQNMTLVIRQFYDGMRAYVRLDERVCSRRFAVEQGLRVLAPLLFNIFFAATNNGLQTFHGGQKHHGRFGAPEEEKGGGRAGEETAGEAVLATPL